MRLLALVLLAICSLSCARTPAPAPESASRTRKNRQLDELSALWSAYKFHYIQDGCVVMLDQDGLTTSEGQSYALLRAVWANDPWTFRDVWRWTRANLQVRPGDKLLAWKWKGKVLDANSATDADVDVALALLLAARRFDAPAYKDEALALLDDIWKHDVLHLGGKHYVSAGNWAPHERHPVLHVAYLAPYAYQLVAGVDARHPWGALVQSSYEVLHWVFFTQGARFTPETIVLDKKTGQLALHPPGGKPADFTYDSVPLPWRLAVDAEWFGRGEARLRERVALVFQEEWRARGKLFDR